MKRVLQTFLLLSLVSTALLGQDAAVLNFYSTNAVSVYKLKTIQLGIPGETFSSPVDVDVREIEFLLEAPGNLRLAVESHILLIGDLKKWNDIVAIPAVEGTYNIHVKTPSPWQGFYIGGFAAGTMVLAATLSAVSLSETLSWPHTLTLGVSGALAAGSLTAWIFGLPSIKVEYAESQ